MASFSERHNYKEVRTLIQRDSLDDETRVEAQNLLVDSDVMDDEIAFFHGFAAGIAAYLLDHNITVETEASGST